MTSASTFSPLLLAPRGRLRRVVATRLRRRLGDAQLRRLTVGEQVTESPPPELLAAGCDESEKACGGCLRIGERVVRLAVRHAQAFAEPLEPDRVLEAPHLCRETRCVDVVGVESRADGARDQSRVERICAVFDEH